MENRTLAQILVTAGFVANAVIDPVDEFPYVLAVTEGDLCTEVSIEPHLAASLGTWLPILFA
jgi:hypothetical protein